MHTSIINDTIIETVAEVSSEPLEDTDDNCITAAPVTIRGNNQKKSAVFITPFILGISAISITAAIANEKNILIKKTCKKLKFKLWIKIEPEEFISSEYEL